MEEEQVGKDKVELGEKRKNMESADFPKREERKRNWHL